MNLVNNVLRFQNGKSSEVKTNDDHYEILPAEIPIVEAQLHSELIPGFADLHNFGHEADPAAIYDALGLGQQATKAATSIVKPVEQPKEQSPVLAPAAQSDNVLHVDFLKQAAQDAASTTQQIEEDYRRETAA